MPKPQTRRTISFKGEIYETLRRHAMALGIPLAALSEQYMLSGLARARVPLVTRKEWLDQLGATKRQHERRVERAVSSNFTF
jgi:hypothetical protein